VGGVFDDFDFSSGFDQLEDGEQEDQALHRGGHLQVSII
jgi:hypothetical protein